MALVRDPITGQMYDDGRPAAGTPVGAVSAGLASLALGGGANPPALPSYPGGQAGRGDLQPTFAQRAGDYQARQAGAAADPLNQAGAVRAADIAQRAISAPLGFPLRPQAGVQGPTAPDISPENQRVLAEDRANLRAAVDALNQNFDTWRVPEPSARPVTGGGAGGAVLSADQQPQRGNYTQTNTDLDALRRRSMGGNGIDLGAGALASQAPAPRTGLNVVGLSRTAEDMMTSDDPFTRAAGRERLRAETALQQQTLANEGELARTETAGRLGLQEATLRGEYDLQGTQLQGEYGLTDRELANAGQVEAERTRGLAGINAAREQAALDPRTGEYAQTAEQLRLRNEMARAALDNGQFDTALRATYGLQSLAPARQSTEIVNDAMGNPVGVRVGGVVQPLDPAMLEELRARGEIFRPQR